MAEEKSPDSFEVRDGFFEVRKTVFGKETVSEDRIRIRPFATNPATVSVKAGATVNLGNFESARIDVMLSMPCYVEEVNFIYEQVKDWVDDRVQKEYKELKESVEGKARP